MQTLDCLQPIQITCGFWKSDKPLMSSKSFSGLCHGGGKLPVEDGAAGTLESIRNINHDTASITKLNNKTTSTSNCAINQQQIGKPFNNKSKCDPHPSETTQNRKKDVEIGNAMSAQHQSSINQHKIKMQRDTQPTKTATKKHPSIQILKKTHDKTNKPRISFECVETTTQNTTSHIT